MRAGKPIALKIAITISTIAADRPRFACRSIDTVVFGIIGTDVAAVLTTARHFSETRDRTLGTSAAKLYLATEQTAA